ncbi:MAG TPA: hypothetical protein VF220_03150 [Nitrososphaeraceae archaeon]
MQSNISYAWWIYMLARASFIFVVIDDNGHGTLEQSRSISERFSVKSIII